MMDADLDRFVGNPPKLIILPQRRIFGIYYEHFPKKARKYRMKPIEKICARHAIQNTIRHTRHFNFRHSGQKRYAIISVIPVFFCTRRYDFTYVREFNMTLLEKPK